MITLFSSYS